MGAQSGKDSSLTDGSDDKKEHCSLCAGSYGKEVEVIFVRHGQSKWNLAKKQWKVWQMAKQRNHPLSSVGRRQCEVLRHQIDNAKDFPRIEVIFSSPLARAIETAILVFPNYLRGRAGAREGSRTSLVLLPHAREKLNLGGLDSKSSEAGTDIVDAAFTHLTQLYKVKSPPLKTSKPKRPTDVKNNNEDDEEDDDDDSYLYSSLPADEKLARLLSPKKPSGTSTLNPEDSPKKPSGNSTLNPEDSCRTPVRPSSARSNVAEDTIHEDSPLESPVALETPEKPTSLDRKRSFAARTQASIIDDRPLCDIVTAEVEEKNWCKGTVVVGESPEDFSSRSDSFMHYLMHSNYQCMAVVGHSHFIREIFKRYLTREFCDEEKQLATSLKKDVIPNCCVVQCRLRCGEGGTLSIVSARPLYGLDEVGSEVAEMSRNKTF